MYDVSNQFLQALQYSHTAVMKGYVRRSDQVVGSFTVLDGSVDGDFSAPIQRNMQVTLVDEEGIYTEDSAEALLNPYGTELRLWRGIQFPDGTQELVPVCTNRIIINNIKDTGGGVQVELEGYDHGYLFQTPYLNPYVINAGMSMEDAIRMGMLALKPGTNFRFAVTNHDAPRLIIQGDDVPWDKFRAMAVSVGQDLGWDVLGVATLTPATARVTGPVMYEFTEGDNAVFWDVEHNRDVSQLPSAVRVISNNSGQSGQINALAQDLDPDSPTYVNGPYGLIVKTIRSEIVHTIPQARDMAAAELTKTLAATEEVTFSAIPNPALQIGDSIYVSRPFIGMPRRKMFIEKLSMPLTVEGVMTVSARRQPNINRFYDYGVDAG